MTIRPLQLPGPLIVPQINWEPLNAVGDAYVKNQERQRDGTARDNTSAVNAQMLASEKSWEGLLKLSSAISPRR